MKPTMIEIHRLEIHPLNVRAKAPFDPDELRNAELIDSIRRHGVLQSLVVVPLDAGRYGVVAGRRRLLAAREAGIAEVPAIERGFTDLEIVAASREENDERESLSIADTAISIANMAAAGHDVDTIATHTGQAPQTVKRLAALANVHPQILDDYREIGTDDTIEKVRYYQRPDHERATGLTLAHLAEYARQPDREAQLTVHRAMMRKSYRFQDAEDVRAALFPKTVAADSRLGRFVFEQYKAAGGPIVEDLFGDNVQLADDVLVENLVEKRLEDERQRLLAQGFGWVEVTDEHNHPARFYDVESPAPKSKKARGACGCLVWISARGELKVERNLIRPADKKKAAAKPGEAPAAPAISQALEQDMRGLLVSVARCVAMVPQHHDAVLFNQIISFEVVRAAFCRGTGGFFNESYVGHDDKVDKHAGAVGFDADEGFEAARAEFIADNAAIAGILGQVSLPDQFEAFGSAPLDDQRQAVVLAVGELLTMSFAREHDALLREAFHDRVRAHWTPTAEHYFGRHKLARLREIAAELMPAEWIADTMPRVSKKHLATALEIAAKDTPDWIPPELRPDFVELV